MAPNPKASRFVDTFASYEFNRARCRWELILYTAPPADRKWFTLTTEVPSEFIEPVVEGKIGKVNEPQGVLAQ